MRRTTVKISDELDARLRHEAELNGKTISEVTREALESYLGSKSPRKLRAAAAGASGRNDISVRIEQILAEEARS
jgi:predicted transcriptional regulator